ncbi:MAG: hypothetical protein KF779_14195 [Hyphomonadaceae bacterium]|nr:hypothetical protein [Hyphomonadaceae bacterium]MCA8886850.1 hypothetical protein [Hyphomonadaceae bacterium]
MKPEWDAIVVAAARFFAPLMTLFALLLLGGRVAGSGVGFVGGLAFGLVLMLHALTFGAAVARAAFPAILARSVLALGIVSICAGAGLPGWTYAAQLIEAGAFLSTVGAAALILQVVFGRAPTLQDGEW